MLKFVCDIGFFKKILSKIFTLNNSSLEREFFGLHFKNPVGLGAGFDKNALYLRELEALGFGFVEIGTVTPLPQSGNEKPRLFRLPKDNALINRMGFNNDGVEIIRKRLEAWHNYKPQTTNYKLIIGGNIGKNKITPNENAWKDYEICFNGLFDYVDYFVVNVSSPNTPGLRELQEKDSLRKILSHLQTINAAKPKRKPLLLKIAPDLTKEQLDDIIELSFEVKLDGLVATNTTIGREFLKTNADKIKKIGAGGLSGKPLMERSTEVLAPDTGFSFTSALKSPISISPLIIRALAAGTNISTRKTAINSAFTMFFLLNIFFISLLFFVKLKNKPLMRAILFAYDISLFRVCEGN